MSRDEKEKNCSPDHLYPVFISRFQRVEIGERLRSRLALIKRNNRSRNYNRDALNLELSRFILRT